MPYEPHSWRHAFELLPQSSQVGSIHDNAQCLRYQQDGSVLQRMRSVESQLRICRQIIRGGYFFNAAPISNELLIACWYASVPSKDL